MSSGGALLIAPPADPIDKLGLRGAREALDVLCGKLLGTGIGRAVYELRHDPTRVVKIETTGGSFQNVVEWETWQALSYTEHARFLAPCHDISPSGIALIQARVRPLPEQAHDDARSRKLLATKLPEYLTDLKRSNYGTIGGKLVCCDYGSNLLLNHGAFSSKLRRPEWRDE